MSDKLQRKFRAAPISDEQFAEDERVREQMMAEFPPVEPTVMPNSSSQVTTVLREAIAGDGDIEAVAHSLNVSASLLRQFMDGRRDLRLSTLEKIAAHFGIKVVAIR